MLLQQNPTLRNTVAVAGREQAMQSFSQQGMLDGYRNIYEEMLHDR